MKNIELKVKTDNFNQIKKLLHKIKAKFKGNLTQKDTYYNCEEGRLKTREINHETFQLIYYERPNFTKSKISNYKIKEIDQKELKEQKTCLTKTKGIKTIVNKRRELWIYKNTRIHLDKVKGLGEYLELETIIKNHKDLQQLETEHRQIINLLGLNSYSKIDKSYSDLLSK